MKNKPNNILILISQLVLLLIFILTFAFAEPNGLSDISSGNKKPNYPQEVIRLPWGCGGLMAGRKDAVESAPEGPMSFDIEAQGQIYLLDQVNFRVLEINPADKSWREIHISSDTFQEVEFYRGKIILLDRIAKSIISIIDPNTGGELSAVPATGKGIHEGGGITAMLAFDDGIWLEYDHRYMVHILNADLSPASREIVKGRKLAGYPPRVIVANLSKDGTARMQIEEFSGGKTLFAKTVGFNFPITRIIWIESDINGWIFAFFHLLKYDDNEPTRVVNEGVAGIIFDEKLDEITRFLSPYTITHWEQFREFRVTPEGEVYQMTFDDNGIKIIRWR